MNGAEKDSGRESAVAVVSRDLHFPFSFPHARSEPQQTHIDLSVELIPRAFQNGLEMDRKVLSLGKESVKVGMMRSSIAEARFQEEKSSLKKNVL
jgi:hypothetical protein